MWSHAHQACGGILRPVDEQTQMRPSLGVLSALQCLRGAHGAAPNQGFEEIDPIGSNPDDDFEAGHVALVRRGRLGPVLGQVEVLWSLEALIGQLGALDARGAVGPYLAVPR